MLWVSNFSNLQVWLAGKSDVIVIQFLSLYVYSWAGRYMPDNLPVPSAFGCVLPGVVGGTLLPAPLPGLGILDGVAVASPENIKLSIFKDHDS